MGKLRISDLTALLGALMLLAAVFLPWWDTAGGELALWDLSVARWFICLAIALALLMTLAALLSRTAEWAVILATPLVIFSFFALAAMLIRLLDAPGSDAEATAGFFLGLAGSIVLFAGACWAIRDESVPDGFAKAPEPERVRVDSAP